MEKALSNSVDVNTGFIIKWDETRQDERTLETIFKDQGNVFNFVRPNNLSNAIHIYVALDASGILNFYVISAENDAAKRFDWVYSAKIKQDKETLPEQTRPPGYIDNNLDWATANSWVNNWIDPTIRASWIHDKFDSDLSKNYIVLAFVINVDDFIPDNVHNCFLALKEERSNNYQIDLVIFNTVTRRIVNKNDSLRDLARPVPPFGGGNGLDYRDFGVLDSLGIQ